MSNTFIDIVLETASSKWCTEPYCTTCGNRDIRTRLKELAGPEGIQIVNALSELKPQEIVTLPNWENCIRLAFFEIQLPGYIEKVLNAWIRNLDEQIRFADIVLFYVVRSLPFRRDIGKDWIEKCISLSMATKNESLIESLLWVLGSEGKVHPDFIKLAQQMQSTRINKALAKCLENSELQ